MADPPGDDWAEDVKFMAGEYIIVGKKPDSNATDDGRLSFDANGKELDFLRSINHATVRDTAFFDTVAGGDQIPVLRLRLSRDGKFYEGTYQWRRDHDHCMQFTGYVYLPNNTTKAPGLETLLPAAPPVSG